MKKHTQREHWKSPSNLAFLLVVLAGFLGAFTTSEGPFTPGRVALLIGLGLVFMILGVVFISWFETLRPPAGSWIYIILQLAIAAAILYLADFNAWVILLPLSSQTVFLFSRRSMLVANILIFSVFIWILDSYGIGSRGLFESGMAFLAGQFFVVVFSQILVSEQKARLEVERLAAELAQANLKLREYAGQVEELSATQERNRLAREIHDGIGHYLTAINMQVKAAQAVMKQDPAQANDALVKAQTLSQDALADVRRSVAALRGEPALSRPLPEALLPLVEETRAAGLVVDFQVCGTERPLSPPAELTLYRTVQEGLTNVRKHALASRVEVILDYQPGSVRLRLSDNGMGLDPSRGASDNQRQQGFGLFGLQERAALLGGTVVVQSVPGQGFELEVELPEEDGGRRTKDKK